MSNNVGKEDMANLGFTKVAKSEKDLLVARYFDSVARQYDFMNTLLSFGIHYLWKHTSMKMLNLKPGEKVIDICGGTGDLSVMARKAVGKSGEVFLFDINREMMLVGKYKSVNAEYRKQIDHVQGNAEKLSFADNTFDAAMVGFGIRNLTNMKQGFIEMHRVLKPGGRMICLEFSRPVSRMFRFLYDKYSFYIMPQIGRLFTGSQSAYTYLPESIRLFPMPDELSIILEDIGFIDVRYKSLTNGIAVVHAGRKKT